MTPPSGTAGSVEVGAGASADIAVHTLYGERIALEWFAGRRVELFSRGYARLSTPATRHTRHERFVALEHEVGEADAMPAHTTRWVIMYEDTAPRRGLFARLVDRLADVVDDDGGVRASTLTLTTAESVHVLVERPATREGGEAAARLVRAAHHLGQRAAHPAYEPSPAGPASAPVDGEGPASEVERPHAVRLRELGELRAEGLLTDVEYQRKRRQLLEEL